MQILFSREEFEENSDYIMTYSFLNDTILLVVKHNW